MTGTGIGRAIINPAVLDYVIESVTKRTFTTRGVQPGVIMTVYRNILKAILKAIIMKTLTKFFQAFTTPDLYSKRVFPTIRVRDSNS